MVNNNNVDYTVTPIVNHLEGWRIKALIISIVMAIGGYLAFSIWGGWQEVVAALVQIGIWGTLLVLAMSLINYSLRFMRWQMYLTALKHPIETMPSFRIYLTGFALTTTPGKAGEAFRGLLLKQRGVPFPESFAAFISERLSDLIAIILLTLFALTQYPDAVGMVAVGVGAIIVFLIVVTNSNLLHKIKSMVTKKPNRINTAISHIATMLLKAQACHKPRLMLTATVISFVAWGAEALAFFWVLEWLGADISLSFAVFVYAISMLAGALSFMPGGLGGAEAVMVSLLVLKGMTMPSAIAATVFIRLATLWFAVILGIIALIMSRNGEQTE